MKVSLYGPCGIFCGACGAQDCSGCQSDNIDEYVENCKFRSCAGEKGLEFCCYCEDYPCTEHHEFMTDKWPHHKTIEPNLKHIKENGLESWLEAQRKAWSCDSCGREIFWYQKSCECGKQLKAWDLPE